MVNATTTGTTCAANCWYAREPECRCSCGGRNHGSLLIDGAEQPRRNCVIDAHRYVLGMIGRHEPESSARAFLRYLRAAGLEERYGSPVGSFGRVLALQNRAGGTVWVRRASEAQGAWPEVAGWLEAERARLAERVYQGRSAHPPRFRPMLLWLRADVAEVYDAWERDGRGE